MRASVESCLFASILAAQSLALPTRPLAAPPPAPVHGEAAAADNLMMAHAVHSADDRDEHFLFLFNFLLLAGGSWAVLSIFGEMAHFVFEFKNESLRSHVRDLEKKNKALRAHAKEKAPGARGNLGSTLDLLVEAEDACDPPGS